MKNKLKVVLDTNIFISGLLIPHSIPYLIIREWQDQQFTLIVSSDLLKEINQVLKRPKIKKYNVTKSDSKNILNLLKNTTELVNPEKADVKVRDAKDQFLIDLALTAGADFLVTGDKDLLVLSNNAELKKTGIVTPSEFVAILEKLP